VYVVYVTFDMILKGGERESNRESGTSWISVREPINAGPTGILREPSVSLPCILGMLPMHEHACMEVKSPWFDCSSMHSTIYIAATTFFN